MTIEDIMYICVLEKFVKLGVPMMPRLENVHESQSGNLKKLTEVCCLLSSFVVQQSPLPFVLHLHFSMEGQQELQAFDFQFMLSSALSNMYRAAGFAEGP